MMGVAGPARDFPRPSLRSGRAPDRLLLVRTAVGPCRKLDAFAIEADHHEDQWLAAGIGQPVIDPRFGVQNIASLGW